MGATLPNREDVAPLKSPESSKNGYAVSSAHENYWRKEDLLLGLARGRSGGRPSRGPDPQAIDPLARGRWQVGDPIYTRVNGAIPHWNTVRERYWKNEAARPGAEAQWGARNVERMQKGRARSVIIPSEGSSNRWNSVMSRFLEAWEGPSLRRGGPVITRRLIRIDT